MTWEVFWGHGRSKFENLESEYIKNFFVPFPCETWGQNGELIIMHFCDDKASSSIEFGYDEEEILAVCISLNDSGDSRDGINYCANITGIFSGEVFYTVNEIFFPKMSIASPEEVFQIALEFISNPSTLPSSVKWIEESEIEWLIDL